MFMLSFYEVTKGILQKLDYYRSRFFCKEIAIKRSIGLQNGILSIDQRIKVDWEF
jgi:hypothetical protein